MLVKANDNSFHEWIFSLEMFLQDCEDIRVGKEQSITEFKIGSQQRAKQKKSLS